ncbi:MAG: hypothetical protein HOH04_03180 [Rhodospirillaceae bacterium]|jgi:hypothetical protein|nr:hypothetical protein [Rhodospirillaceae bacterium]
MGEKKQPQTDKSRKALAQSDRQERLADALRANLSRRKAQLRARQQPDADSGPNSVEVDIKTEPD